MEYIAVAVIVACAALYFLRATRRSLEGKGCECTCKDAGACGLSDPSSCSEGLAASVDGLSGSLTANVERNVPLQ